MRICQKWRRADTLSSAPRPFKISGSATAEEWGGGTMLFSIFTIPREVADYFISSFWFPAVSFGPMVHQQQLLLRECCARPIRLQRQASTLPSVDTPHAQLTLTMRRTFGIEDSEVPAIGKCIDLPVWRRSVTPECRNTSVMAIVPTHLK